MCTPQMKHTRADLVFVTRARHEKRIASDFSQSTSMTSVASRSSISSYRALAFSGNVVSLSAIASCSLASMLTLMLPGDAGVAYTSLGPGVSTLL